MIEHFEYRQVRVKDLGVQVQENSPKKEVRRVLVDGEPLAAGQVLRVVTTGGGGWGDPLDREPELVQRDVIQGKVSIEAARGEYGVALVPGASDGEYEIGRAATEELRAAHRAARKSPPPMIDRGPGYERMVERSR